MVEGGLHGIKARLENFEIARNIRATMLLGTQDKSIVRSPEYQRALPQIKDLYSQAWRWHGTGRYQYTPPNYETKRDVIQGILQNNGLVPHRDLLDYSRGIMYSISTSPSRLYSSLYAQLHYEKGKRLRNPFLTGYGWAVFMRGIAETAITKDRQLLNRQFRQDKGLTNDGTLYFHQKYTKSAVQPKEMIMGGQSDIQDNYPILIGITKNAFPEEDIAVVLRKHESRSTVPIEMNKFTHIEVPLVHVNEVKTLLKETGYEDTVVLPMEWGEAYSKTLPISWIVDGKPFK